MTKAAQLTSAHKLFCFGYGYSAAALADRLMPQGVRVAGTRTQIDPSPTTTVALTQFGGGARSDDVAQLLAGTTHLLVSIPPDVDGDRVLWWHAADLAALPSLVWIGYLSTVGVYGDAAGAWVDEQTPLRPQSARAQRRVIAEGQWRAFGSATAKAVDIFRLPGIYGPGRSAIEALEAGTARRLIKPGQVFNRVHVTDIAGALAGAMTLAAAAPAATGSTYNLADDDPAPPQDVVTFAADLLGVLPPPEVPFDAATLSPMSASFYSECKRVDNRHLKQSLGYIFTYPTYREGLRAIALYRQQHC